MKNYIDDSWSIEEKENFILNYEISGNKIIVNFADGRDYSILNTRDNELKLLDKMKSQLVTYSGDDKNNKNNKNNMYSKKEKLKVKEKLYKFNKRIEKDIEKKVEISICELFAIFLVFLFVGIFYLPAAIIISIPITSSMIYNIGKVVYDFKYGKMLNQDVEKNLLFLKNEDIINNSLNNNKNVLNNLNKNSFDVINNSLNNKNNIGISLNTIDQLSLDELKQLIKNINFEETLNLEEQKEMDKLLSEEKQRRISKSLS